MRLLLHRLKSARDHRRKRQDFSRRLELDLEFARIEQVLYSSLMVHVFMFSELSFLF